MVGESSPPPAGDFEVPTKLCVGIALSTSPNTTRGLLEQLCLELQDATGIDVEARGMAHYDQLLDALAVGRVDIVWLPPVLALRALLEGRAEPLALPIRNGLCSYWAALFSRADSSIRECADLRRVSAAWVDPQSASGYRIIRSHLERQGVDLRHAFIQERFLGAHDAVAAAVRDGEVDVGATYAYFDLMTPQGGKPISAGWGDADMHIVACAGPIPSDVIASRKGVSSLVVRLVQSALVDVQNAELRRAAQALLGAEGFMVPSEEHLEPLRELLRGELDESRPPASVSIVPPPMR